MSSYFGRPGKSRFGAKKSGYGFDDEETTSGTTAPPSTPELTNTSSRRGTATRKKQNQKINHAKNSSVAQLNLAMLNNSTDIYKEAYIKETIEQLYQLFTSEALLKPNVSVKTEMSTICSHLYKLRKNTPQDEDIYNLCDLIEESIGYFDANKRNTIQKVLEKMRASLAKKDSAEDSPIREEKKEEFTEKFTSLPQRKLSF